MDSEFVVLLGFIIIQGATCAPVTTTPTQSGAVSYGTQFADEMDKGLTTARHRLNEGFSLLTKPSFKFLNSAPSLLNLGVHTVADKAVKISEANKEAFGKITSGLGHSFGGAALFGGSVAGGAMEVIGEGLSAGNNVMEAAAKLGIGLAGQMADNKTDMINVAGTISNSALNAMGGGMSAVAEKVNAFSNALSGSLDAIGVRMAQCINKAQTMAAEMMRNDALSMENDARKKTISWLSSYYNALNSLLKVLEHMQDLFDSATSSISSAETVTTPSGTSASGTTVSGTTTSGTTTAGTSAIGTTASAKHTISRTAV